MYESRLLEDECAESWLSASDAAPAAVVPVARGVEVTLGDHRLVTDGVALVFLEVPALQMLLGGLCRLEDGAVRPPQMLRLRRLGTCGVLPDGIPVFPCSDASNLWMPEMSGKDLLS